MSHVSIPLLWLSLRSNVVSYSVFFGFTVTQSQDHNWYQKNSLSTGIGMHAVRDQ